MGYYQCKAKKLAGTSYKEVWRKVLAVYSPVKKRTKRKPYVRSRYFSRDKVFFDYFFVHLASKREPDRVRRLRYFEAAIELIRNSTYDPESMQNPTDRSGVLHRFVGKTKEGDEFFVQIKEYKKTGRKQLMSCFPKR